MRLLVCTRAHAHHYGLAAPIAEASGCELWIHPAWDHVRSFAEDPDAALDQRIEIARQSGEAERVEEGGKVSWKRR